MTTNNINKISLTAFEIRNQFLDFFRMKQHQIVPSAPIVVKNDPTLMFTNAGMNQFKDYFLGNKPAPYPRIADTQKCLRVSGKHNDLEEVGVDTYHHTMFEMLGNWSFGDAGSKSGTGYFKKEAIEWSWELLNKVFQIPKDRLYVTVFEGDEKEGLPKDDEAANEWKKWIDADRILLGNKKDNFWEMGDTGPCGPCTEIHVDCRPDEERKKIEGKTLVNNDHPQVIEIWNNVFIQFNRLKDGSLELLPAKHVDTGMGFERLVRVLQNKNSNYDTDIFTGTISKVEEITGKKYSGGDDKPDIAFRVLADHIRAISFTIADGQLPSNTGAGYVIRRILRRAVRYYYSYLDYQQPLLFQLVPVLARQFENVFPELYKQEQFVSKVIREEEEAFLRTLEKGLQLFYNLTNQPITTLKAENKDEFIEQMHFKASHSHVIEKKIIPGLFAFKLSDTYGFPIDLTNLLAREVGWKVDMQGFEEEMQKQKQRSRAASTIDTSDWIILNEEESNSQFVGYDHLETNATILRYRKVKTKGKDLYQIVLDRTPFYAESGGQVGDTGQLAIGNKQVAIVDTKKENDLIVHFAENLPADISGEVVAKVDIDKRKKTAVHHSATHLLHAALRKVLGTHVAQKGSLVNADYLRFDFSHFSKMSDEEIKQVEELVNQKIRENIPVVIRQMPKEEAMQTGAMALFGEKYGDTVRVVTIDPASSAFGTSSHGRGEAEKSPFSIELCGGTHVGFTGDLGFFKIISEGAVAAGVRRIEAVSGLAAEEYAQEQFDLLNTVKVSLKNPKDIIKSIESLQEDSRNLIKTKAELNRLQSQVTVDRLVLKAENINGYKFYHDIILNSDLELLKMIVSELDIKDSEKEVALLLGKKEGKVYALIALSEDLKASMDASVIVKEIIAPIIKGGGGGQKTLATAGGQDSSALSKVIEAVKALL